MWEAGTAENRSGGQVSGRGARSGNTAVRVRCVKTAGFRRCIVFLRYPSRERTRPGQIAGNQVEAWSIGNMIRELMLMKFSH
jgi:hypothetical protein